MPFTTTALSTTALSFALTSALAAFATPALSLAASQALVCRPFMDFADPQEVERWRVVNDGVMGGRSSGRIRSDGEGMLYTGVINTNGGGFSSIRRAIEPGALAKAVALKINHHGDERGYKLSIRSSATYRGRPISFQAPIPAGDEGGVVYLDDLKGSFRGFPTPGARFERDQAVEIGLILADGRDGPFEMALRSIEICEAAGEAV